MEAGGEQTSMTRLLDHIIMLFVVYLREVTSRTGNNSKMLEKEKKHLIKAQPRGGYIHTILIL